MKRLITLGVIFVFLGGILPDLCKAQNHGVSGVVKNKATNEVLPGVNIFLDQTTIGTTSDEDGSYQLLNLPEGTYNVIFSFVGFKRIKKELVFPRKNSAAINILLEPETVVLDELVVRAKYPKEWLKDLETFKKEFLGVSRNSRKTEILNPEVLYFEKRGNHFIAYSQAPLEIVNKALGYKITFYLQKFILTDEFIQTDATSKFTLLEPENDKQLKNWEKERIRAYKGSFRHFIHALINEKLHDEGFRILFTSKKIIFQDENRQSHRAPNYDEAKVEVPKQLWNYQNIGQIKLQFFNEYRFLKVIYLKERPEPSITRAMKNGHMNNEISFLELPKGMAIMDVRSAYSLPQFVPMVHGYWAWNRIPEWLPKEYKLQ